MPISDAVPAIPLWINGRAYLTVAPAFRDVRNPSTGQVLRRTPLCGEVEARLAVDSAQAAVGLWGALTEDDRAALLATTGEALAGYAEHFARLIAEETGLDSLRAEAEVAEAVALLEMSGIELSAKGDASRSMLTPEGWVLVISSINKTFVGLLRRAIPALLAGFPVIVRPDPERPSAIFALAELTGRCGFPPGVFNLLHGDEAVLDSLRSVRGVDVCHV